MKFSCHLSLLKVAVTPKVCLLVWEAEFHCEVADATLSERQLPTSSAPSNCIAVVFRHINRLAIWAWENPGLTKSCVSDSLTFQKLSSHRLHLESPEGIVRGLRSSAAIRRGLKKCVGFRDVEAEVCIW